MLLFEGSFYSNMKTWNALLFISQVLHICFCLWISVCSCRSRRVAFSREIWRAINRSLPEHQALCCCCCSYLCLLFTTTPVSVSLDSFIYSTYWSFLSNLSRLSDFSALMLSIDQSRLGWMFCFWPFCHLPGWFVFCVVSLCYSLAPLKRFVLIKARQY